MKQNIKIPNVYYLMLLLGIIILLTEELISLQTTILSLNNQISVKQDVIIGLNDRINCGGVLTLLSISNNVFVPVKNVSCWVEENNFNDSNFT